jgi:hypothetical protein
VIALYIEKMSVSRELKPTTRLVPAGTTQGPPVGEAVARSEAELGIQPISGLLEVEGIDVVGPLPAESHRLLLPLWPLVALRNRRSGHSLGIDGQGIGGSDHCGSFAHVADCGPRHRELVQAGDSRDSLSDQEGEIPGD